MAYQPYTTGLGSVSPDAAQKSGLGTAKNWLQEAANKQYTYRPYVADQLQGPVTPDFYQMQNLPEYQQAQAPGYMGMGPLDQMRDQWRGVADTAYGRNVADINNAMGANGLYGSSGQGMHSDALAGAGQVLQQGYASAEQMAQQMRQQDLQNQNQFNLSNYGMGMEDSLNAWRAGQTNAALQQQYDASKWANDAANQQAQVDWSNYQLQAPGEYQMAQQDWQQGLDDWRYGQALSLAGLGNNQATLLNSQLAAQGALANQQQDTANNQMLWQGIGGVAGIAAPYLLDWAFGGSDSGGSSGSSGTSNWSTGWF